MANKELKRRLLRRDGGLCGIHVGGCGKPLTFAETTVDHIIPRNVWNTDVEVFQMLSGKDRDQLLQPMHHACNNDRKHGQLDIDFACNCHSSHTSRNKDKVYLEVGCGNSVIDGYIVKLPVEEVGVFLIVNGKTQDGALGYRRQQFGGCFESPFRNASDNLVLSLVPPVPADALPEYRSTCSADSQEITIQTYSEKARQIQVGMKAFLDDWHRMQAAMANIVAYHAQVSATMQRVTFAIATQWPTLDYPKTLAIPAVQWVGQGRRG